MALTLGPLLLDAGIDPKLALVIRHPFVREHEDNYLLGIHADSTDAEILEYTRSQSLNTMRFRPPSRRNGWSSSEKVPTRLNSGLLWRIVRKRLTTVSFACLTSSNLKHMADLRGRLVLGRKSLAPGG